MNLSNLHSKSNPELAEFGRDYIVSGADMHRDLELPEVMAKPYPCPNETLNNLAAKHLVEMHEKGFFIGPFDENNIPFKKGEYYLSPVFVKEKDLSRGKILFLIDYSAPKGNSINSAIPPHHTTMDYPRLLSFVKLAVLVGPNGHISVADLKDAYYYVFIQERFTPALGFMVVQATCPKLTGRPVKILRRASSWASCGPVAQMA